MHVETCAKAVCLALESVFMLKCETRLAGGEPLSPSI